MISKLRKKLALLFVALTMLVFTAMQGVMLYSALLGDWADEMMWVEIMADELIQQLHLGLSFDELDSYELYEKDTLIFISYEQKKYDNLDAWGERGAELLKQVESGKPLSRSGGGSEDNQTSILTRPIQGKDFRRIYETKATFVENEMTLIRPGNTIWTLLWRSGKWYPLVWLAMLGAMCLLSRYFVKKALQPVEASIQSQRNFVAAASHELKTPLAVIHINAETMPDGNPERKRRIILDECDRMSGLIRSLLALASSDAGNWKMNMNETNVDTLLIEVWEAFSEPAHKKHIALNLDMDEHYPKIICDEERLRQAIGILVDNAISYSPTDSRIYLGARVEKENLIFAVVDHGPGIPENEKEKVFERFYSCDPSRTDKSHYGLGLSIAQEIVKAHHGTIRLSDTPGGGCTFEIKIPTY